MTAGWPTISYDRWARSCDTLHAHTQVLGKFAARLAPPEPELQHAALRLTARGWETAPLPAPDGSGSLVVALDLHTHQAVVEHSGGPVERVPLTPNRAVADVTSDVLVAVAAVGGAVQINPVPQEVPWTVPLDQDYEHASYDPDRVSDYFAAATQAALTLAAPGRPGEFHPRAPTDRSVKVSLHSARLIQSRVRSRSPRPSGRTGVAALRSGPSTISGPS
jgi:hypothetical protein